MISLCKLPAQWTLFDTCSELCPFVRTFIATADKCCLVRRSREQLSGRAVYLLLTNLFVSHTWCVILAHLSERSFFLHRCRDRWRSSPRAALLRSTHASVGIPMPMRFFLDGAIHLNSRSNVSDLIESGSCCSSLDQVSRGQRAPLGHFRICG